VGSSHEWNFTDNLPSQLFLEKTTQILGQWLKEPFTVKDHLASIRPATVERRPFVGMHPHFPSIGILNGMGTKGCSLAPYFAHQLVCHLTENKPILPEADINRFSRILNSLN
jgi:glycine/D-amino acid oxidase-like deaminating enzyme